MFFIQKFFYQILMLGLKVAVKFIPQPQPIIYSGKNSALELAQLIINQDYKRILIVTDAVLNKLGIANNFCQLLTENKIEFVIFDQVTPDPSEQVIDEGIKQALSTQCDLVLGIGGGSSLDAAKMIAVLSQPNRKLKQSVKSVAGILKIKRRGLPLFLLPTTSGTGSEVTMVAVITDSGHQTKSLVISPKMMPIATALDPVLMQGMPAKITADTGFDALTHAIESYLSTHANEQTNLYALTAIKLIFKQLPIAYKNGDDLAARQSMAIASCYAGLAFTKAGLGYVHAISHQIGAKYHSPHGLTNAVILPVVLNFNLEACKQRLAILAKKIGLPTCTLNDAQAAALFIDAVKTLQHDVGIPNTLACIKLGDINELVKAALKEAHYLYPVPKYLDKSQCRKIITQLMPASASI